MDRNGCKNYNSESLLSLRGHDLGFCQKIEIKALADLDVMFNTQ